MNGRSDPGNQNEHRLTQLIQGKAERHLKGAANIDPGELSSGNAGLREDQTTARKTDEHCRNRNKTAHRFPAQCEKRDNTRAKQRSEQDDPRKRHIIRPRNTQKIRKF